MFLTSLHCTQVSPDEWELADDFKYASKLLDRVIVVPKGFRFDFASVPRLPLMYAVFGNTAHKAATVHDWLYTSKQHPDSTPDNLIYVNRKTADAIFEEACKCELPSWKATLMWLGVRMGGSGHWRT